MMMMMMMMMMMTVVMMMMVIPTAGPPNDPNGAQNHQIRSQDGPERGLRGGTPPRAVAQRRLRGSNI
eukprot:3390042-Pyramimonas_sp.AAC.1